MENHSVRLTVLMSVYNGQQYLGQAIESILNQTFRDFEFLIIDDGSTDQSASIVQKFADLDPRIRVIQQAQNIGLTKALNLGIREAAGEYIARQDCDDISYPDRLQKALTALDAHPNLAFVTSSFHLIDAEGRTSGTLTHDQDADLNRWNMLFSNAISAHSAVTFRKNLVLKVGGYDESLRYAQDYDLWLRLMEDHEIYSYPEPLAALRYHAANLSNRKKAEQQQCALIARQRSLRRLSEDIRLDDDMLEILSDFWLQRLPSGQDASLIHANMRMLFSLFVKRYHPGKIAGKKIRRRCSNRFLEAIARVGDWKIRLKLLIFAINWSPYATLCYCIQSIR
jgi:glycosyltransferase involved in cell wall biosynthesis